MLGTIVWTVLSVFAVMILIMDVVTYLVYLGDRKGGGSE